MFSMLRKLVNLAIVLLIVNALYQFLPPYVHYIQFRDGVKEVAIFSREVPDSALVDKILALAEENKVPVGREDIAIRHEPTRIYIDASYVQIIRFLPGYEYAWTFEVKTDAAQIKPHIVQGP